MTKTLDELLIEIDKSKKDLNVLYWLRFRPLLNYFDSFIFHINISQKHYIA